MNLRTLFLVSIICACCYNCLATDENVFLKEKDMIAVNETLDKMLHEAINVLEKTAENAGAKGRMLHKFGVLPKERLAELEQRADNVKLSVVGVDKTSDIFPIFQDLLTEIHQFIHIMEVHTKDEL